MSPSIARAESLFAAGKTAEAVETLRLAVRRSPRDAEVHGALGELLFTTGQPELGERSLMQAAALTPASARWLFKLACLYQQTSRYEAARDLYERTLALEPGNVEAMLGVSGCAAYMHDIEEAEAFARRAFEARPGYAAAYHALAQMLNQAGRPAEATAVYEEAVARPEIGVNLGPACVMNHHYRSACDPHALFEAHKQMGARLAAALPEQRCEWPNDRGTSRVLRIGYLSSDLRNHAVAYFMEGIIRAHDPARVDLYAYHTGNIDSVSQRLLPFFKAWRNAERATNQEIVDGIRADRIDVLVDLNGLTGAGSVEVLCRRAAPVQATYLGYPNTTALPTVQYRIVDGLTDPPGAGDALATEKLVRLGRCFLAYRPLDDAPASTARSAGPLVGSTRPVVFGSFNAPFKLNAPCLARFARTVLAVPGGGARLYIKNDGLKSPRVRERTLAMLEAAGLARERVQLASWVESKAAHLASFTNVDIALDSFPYHGTTTTCEALWMGTPVVSLVGGAHVCRVGKSILEAVGLDDLTCESEGEFVARAVALANDRARLDALHAGLRATMASSPLCDGADMARRLEAAYADMWAAWVANPV
ncbi:MAG: tetratricopeptide repeat protein [Phycisphaerales bacterium]